MKAVLGALALLSFTATAAADWEFVGKSAIVMAYADSSSIRTNGHMVKMWMVFDFLKQRTWSGKTYWSNMYQWEFNCDAESVRPLYYTSYAKKMGSGLVVDSGHFNESFSPAGPGTVGRGMLDIACAGHGKLTKVNG